MEVSRLTAEREMLPREEMQGFNFIHPESFFLKEPLSHF